jgi:hypothetical protein
MGRFQALPAGALERVGAVTPFEDRPVHSTTTWPPVVGLMCTFGASPRGLRKMTEYHRRRDRPPHFYPLYVQEPEYLIIDDAVGAPIGIAGARFEGGYLS